MSTDPAASTNDVDSERSPDPDAAVLARGDEQPGGGRDATDADQRSSLHPGGGTKDGPKNDVNRAQPYDEQPIGLRMEEQPFEPDGQDGPNEDGAESIGPATGRARRLER